MSADTWFLIAIISFSLSGVALIAAVFMFIKMNIPSIIGDLNGKTVAREIRAMREANAAANQSGHAMPMYPGARVRTGRTSRLTSTSPRAAATPSQETAPSHEAAPATDVLTDSECAATDVLSPDELSAAGESADNTTAATEVLTPDTTPATEVLSSNITDPMPNNTCAFNNAAATTGEPVPFTVTRSLVFIHTTETI